MISAGGQLVGGLRQSCSVCRSGSHVRAVYLPYVYRYLTNELAAMGTPHLSQFHPNLSQSQGVFVTLGIKLSLKLSD
jgi:hypothetical protein